jgi:hypothetical protein
MSQKTIDAKTLEYAAWKRARFDQFKRKGGYKQIRINRLTVIHAIQSWRDDLNRFGDYHYPNQPLPTEKLSPFKQID